MELLSRLAVDLYIFANVEDHIAIESDDDKKAKNALTKESADREWNKIKTSKLYRINKVINFLSVLIFLLLCIAI